MKTVAKVKGREYRERNELCLNCLHVCSSAELLTSHQKVCLKNDSVQITMPTGDKNVKFEKYAARWFSHFVVYLDLGSLVVPVATVRNNPTISSTSALEQHLPCSYYMIVFERNNPEPLHFDIYTGLDCMERVVSKTEKLAKNFYHQKRNSHVFLGQHLQETRGQSVGLVKLISTMIPKKVLDHCHFNGQFIGYAHSECNLKRRTLNYTPVIAQNMMNYDLHHIVKSLHSASQSTEIEVIPTNDEKSIALNFGVFIETRKRKRDEVAE